MIKGAGTTRNGQPLLIIGLSEINVTRLMAGEPILFETGHLGLPPLHVLILGGRTEETIAADMRQHLRVDISVTME